MLLPQSPAAFRAALEAIPALERDAWVDRLLQTAVPDDGPALPAGCVPYLPCTADVLLRVIDEAAIGRGDVFVDVGAGAGRTAALIHLMTGATVIGLEIQPHLVTAARDLAARLDLSRLSFIEGDAVNAVASTTGGTVFFLNCPFSGERVERVLDALEPLARQRPIRVCAVDLPMPARAWLVPLEPATGSLVVYRGYFTTENGTG